MNIFFKPYPFFYLDKKSIIKEHLNERIGKFKEFNFYIVENEYSSTKYKDYNKALEHFNINKNINISILKDIERRNKQTHYEE